MTVRTATLPHGGAVPGSVIARNSVLNLAGQVLPLAVGVVAIPLSIRGLGTERFGVLALIWAVVGYFGFLDLGLGQATTKFGAELVGRRQAGSLPNLLWTSLIAVGILGGFASLVFALAAPVLAEKAFHLSPALSGEARGALTVTAAMLPVLFAIGVLRGLLAALHRFDLINLVQIPLASTSYAIPAVAALMGLRLTAITFCLVVTRVTTVAVMLLMLWRLLPDLFRHVAVDRRLLRRLLDYGGWLTLGGVVNPCLVYLDRFLVGALASMEAVTHYTAPYEIASRLCVFPASISASLFPALSSLRVAGQTAVQQDIVLRSVRLLLLAAGPVSILMIVFARDLIGLWLGTQFVAQSAPVLQIIAAGALINALGWILIAVVQANGRPDLPPKFNIVELLVHLPLAWVLVRYFGVVGAAWAWTARVTLEAVLLGCAAFRLIDMRHCRLLEWQLWRRGLPLAGFSGLIALVCWFDSGLAARALAASSVLALYSIGVWQFGLEDNERRTVLGGISRVFAREDGGSLQ